MSLRCTVIGQCHDICRYLRATGPQSLAIAKCVPQFSAGIDPLKETVEALASLRCETSGICHVVSRHLFVIPSVRWVCFGPLLFFRKWIELQHRNVFGTCLRAELYWANRHITLFSWEVLTVFIWCLCLLNSSLFWSWLLCITFPNEPNNSSCADRA